MRALRWPGFWLAMWLGAIVAVVVLSLVPPPTVTTSAPQHFDKLLHFGAYFTLALAAVQLFARWRALLVVGFGLVLLGVALEWAQGAWVPHLRMFDVWDAVANAVGAIAGIGLALTPVADVVLRLEQRLCRGRAAPARHVDPAQ